MFDRAHARVEAEGIIQRQNLCGRNVDRRTEIVVEPVGIGDNGIEAVVAAV
jgi:hypothetical protein